MADFDQASLEHGEQDPLEAELIDAARCELPPTEARAQLLATLNLAPAPGPAEVPARWGAAGVARVLGLALAIGAGAVIVVSTSTGGDPSENVAATLQTFAPTETQAPTAAPAEAQEESPPSPAPSQRAEPVRATPAPVWAGTARAGHAARSAGTAARPQIADAPAASTLGRELARVTAARSALTGGETARALQELDAYDAEFPAGAFSVEVVVLRVEALARSGHAEEARRVGNSFLAQHPEGLPARRVVATLQSIARVDDEPPTR